MTMPVSFSRFDLAPTVSTSGPKEGPLAAQEDVFAMQDSTFDSPDTAPHDLTPFAAESDFAASPCSEAEPAVLEHSEPPLATGPDIRPMVEPEHAFKESMLSASMMEAGVLKRGRRRDLESGPLSLDTLKIVYWGPGRSGKTTNVKWLHGRLRPDLRGQLIDIDTPGDRTLYFDCLPLHLSSPGEAPVQLRVYTVPGQPRFRLTRRLVLEGADGIVFVWDTRARRLNANLVSLIELRETLAELDVPASEIPQVVQYNKSDLPDRIPPEELDHVLNRMGERVPRVVAVATRGIGVLESLGAITTAALRRYQARCEPEWLSTATGI
jgi:signal recognition particle receptor subunit beta